jgi:hypothetical protein
MDSDDENFVPVMQNRHKNKVKLHNTNNRGYSTLMIIMFIIIGLIIFIFIIVIIIALMKSEFMRKILTRGYNVLRVNDTAVQLPPPNVTNLQSAVSYPQMVGPNIYPPAYHHY